MHVCVCVCVYVCVCVCVWVCVCAWHMWMCVLETVCCVVNGLNKTLNCAFSVVYVQMMSDDYDDGDSVIVVCGGLTWCA